MRINWALLCNQVQINPQGSYDLFGVREELLASIVPCALGRLAVVVSMKIITPGRSNVWIIGRQAQSNQIIFHSDPSEHVISSQGLGDQIDFIIPIYVQDVTLPEFGLYTLDVLKNDQIIYTNSFRLRSSPHGQIKH